MAAGPHQGLPGKRDEVPVRWPILLARGSVAGRRRGTGPFPSWGRWSRRTCTECLGMLSFRTVVHPWGEAGCALGVRKGRPDVWGDAGEEAVTRARDWWVQAQADLRHAHDALEGKAYEWACFAAQQAGEKALRAAFEQRGEKVWGHSITRMLQVLCEEGLEVSAALLDAARVLDKHYIPTRYPNSLEQGAPGVLYPESGSFRTGCSGRVSCYPGSLVTSCTKRSDMVSYPRHKGVWYLAGGGRWPARYW